MKFWYFMCCLVAFSCGSQTETLKTVSIDETGVFGETIEIKLLSVTEDSRCPVDVECVWEGKVEARFQLLNGKDSVVFELSTISASFFEYENHFIRIKKVSPDRYSEREIQPEDYRVQLHIE